MNDALELARLQAYELEVAETVGIAYIADGVSSAPGPMDVVLRTIRENRADANEVLDLRNILESVQTEAEWLRDEEGRSNARLNQAIVLLTDIEEWGDIFEDDCVTLNKIRDFLKGDGK